ncbi:MAG: hypothetical protein BIP78_1487 [Candidatus Bipolaricaulis sibiricus]|uniref:Uncharacterized protein n=1 Tax=Bipolaricaulis sibiricus TaxID=2501609 RepID=A0A410FW53_BIPS1|nr:MAG: hypothetical protein BIP78_1487 [Candidatus Bipolaricaulis sibiricus]
MRRWIVLGMALAMLGAGAVAQDVDARNIGDQLLTFIQSTAELVGRGVVWLINLVLPADRAVGPDLVQPLGYLGLITILLLLFGIIEAARKVIWIVVIVGWVLLLVRIVLDALRAS